MERIKITETILLRNKKTFAKFDYESSYEYINTSYNYRDFDANGESVDIEVTIYEYPNVKYTLNIRKSTGEDAHKFVQYIDEIDSFMKLYGINKKLKIN